MNKAFIKLASTLLTIVLLTLVTPAPVRADENPPKDDLVEDIVVILKCSIWKLCGDRD